MNISKLLLVLSSVLFTASTAFAQASAYGTVTVRRMTDIPYTQGTSSFPDGVVDPVGATFGVYYDFMTLGPVRLGADLRGSIETGTQGAYRNFNGGGTRLGSGLGGVRVSFHTPMVRLKPYIQGSAGVARTNFGTQYNIELVPDGISKSTGIQLSTCPEFDVFAGADYTLLPVMDFRVELGYGAIIGSSHTSPVQSISTGVVFHLPFGR